MEFNNTRLRYSLILIMSGGLLACEQPNQQQWRERQHLPKEGFVANKIKGDQLFHSLCAQCHGTAAKGGEQGPPLVHKIYEPSHHADLAFHWAVRDGVRQHHWKFGNMPPIKDASPEDVGHIIAYIRGKQRAAGIN